METRDALVAQVAVALSGAGFQEPRRHARRLVASALAISRADLFGHPDLAVDEQQISRVRVMLGRLVEREPLSRILGRREFWGLEFALSADTFDPRPETETVVEAILRRVPDRGAPLRFLDLGTGTGCILLALLSEFPAALGIGVDIAPGAAMTARVNAAGLGLADRAHFLAANWAAAISGEFDVIVANPPYIARNGLADLPQEVARYDPCGALDGGRDGLGAYRSLGAELPRVLAPGGLFACEIGLHQAPAVAEILRGFGLVINGCDRDLAGVARCVVARSATSVAQKIVGQKVVGMQRGP